jgi:serine/threonine protein kinase
MAALVPGTIIGSYRLIAPIGRGGMGGVWEVENRAGQRYALKSPATDLDPELTKRFAREANALRLLDHPNLVASVDVFAEAGSLYLVMEHVRGRTLTAATANGPLHPRLALVFVRQILEGVGHAHALGLVHRDLKPDNIMLVEMGGWERAKIVDFGLVKLLGDAEAAIGGAKLTRTGVVSGTPAYMSPEQALGRIVDARADLYAIGVILYELLAGRLPFDHPEVQMVMRMHVKNPVPALDLAPEVVALVGGALAKDPAHRFASSAAMIAALDCAFDALQT